MFKKVLMRKIRLDVLLSPKFLVIAFFLMSISIYVMKLMIIQLELTGLVRELIVYGPAAIVVTCLAIVWDNN